MGRNFWRVKKKVMIKPFEDKELVQNIIEERDRLLESLENEDMSDSEKRFLIKKIKHISEKLLEKARYGK